MLALALAAAACTPKTYAGTEDVTLPTSTSPLPAPKVGDPDVRIVSYGARRGLLVDGAVVVGPASPLGGAPSGGLLVPELVSAMGAATPSSRRVVLAIDANAPYEVVARLVYTVGQIGVDSIEFLVRGADGARVLALAMPRSGERICVARMVDDVAPALSAALGDPRDGGARLDASPAAFALDPSSTALCLVVHLSSRGARVASAGRALSASCDGPATSDDPAFPSVRDPGVRRCMSRLAQHPAAASGRVMVSADRDVPLRDVIAALDAVRVDGMAEPALGMAR
jgi:biopolymer transport protein ExbD